MKRIVKNITLFIFAFLPQVIFAATDVNSTTTSAWLNLKSFTPPPTDWSVGFLTQIFGNVGDVLHGTTITVLGQLFGVFNAGLLSIAGVFLIYTTTRSIMDTAQDGEAMGKKLTHWVAVRTAFGVGVLVPKFSGFSAIQIFVMWAVLQGVGLADMAWDHVLTFLHSGGSIFVLPATTDKTDTTGANYIDPHMVYSTNEKAGAQAGASEIMKSQICMYALQRSLNKKSLAARKELQQVQSDPTFAATKTSAEIQAIKQQATQTIVLAPGFYEKEQYVAFPGKITDPEYKELDGKCGEFSWALASNDNLSKAKGDEYAAAKEAGLRQMILDMSPQADIVERASATPPTPPAKGKGSLTYYDKAPSKIPIPMPDDFPRPPPALQMISAAAGYQAIIYPYRMQKKSNFTDVMYGAAKDQGWSMAGRYYIDLAAANDKTILETDNYKITIKQWLQSDYLDKHYPKMWKRIDNNADLTQGALPWLSNVSNYATLIVKYLNTVGATGEKSGANLPSYLFQFPYTFSLSPADIVATVGAAVASGIVGQAGFGAIGIIMLKAVQQIIPAMLAWKVSNVLDMWNDQMNLNINNLPPILRLKALGKQMIKSAGEFWGLMMDLMYYMSVAISGVSSAITYLSGIASVAGFMMAGAAAATTTASSLLQLAYNMLQTTLLLMLPVALSVITPMFVLGITLAIYVPLVPFMLFTFGVISWLISVIEAMAAAPLVALGITHPEGHDLLGKSEQSVMLLFSVFLRPICMIIGLVSAIILSYVALEVLNAGFSGIVSDLAMTTSPAHFTVGQAYIFPIVSNMGVLIVYTLIVVAIINQTFALIHIIPEKVMRWLGMHPEQTGEMALVESVKSGMMPFAEAGGGAGKGGVEAVAGKAAQMPSPNIPQGGDNPISGAVGAASSVSSAATAL